MTQVYIGLGSNLSNPKAQIVQAITLIQGLESCCVSRISSLYFSRPMGPQDQPDYMNAVLCLDTQLSAVALLDQLQTIENKAGRIRKNNRWGPRILDLDILLFGNDVINTERLTVPHYGLTEREFVLIPLAEIASTLLLPNKKSIGALADGIPTNGLKIHSQLN